MTASRDGREPLSSIRDRVQASVVGRERELGLVLAAVAAGRDVILEGPPGTSKSTLLRAITRVWGAIDLTLVAGQLFSLDPERLLVSRGPAFDSAESAEAKEASYRETIYDAMVVALSGRIFLDETVEATPEQVLRQIWEDHFILHPAAAQPG